MSNIQNMKPNRKDFITRKIVKAGDFSNVEIESVDIRELHGKEKVVISLKGIPYALVLNNTNLSTVSGVLGDETDDWKGATMSIMIDEVPFNGENTQAVIVTNVRKN